MTTKIPTIVPSDMKSARALVKEARKSLSAKASHAIRARVALAVANEYGWKDATDKLARSASAGMMLNKIVTAQLLKSDVTALALDEAFTTGHVSDETLIDVECAEGFLKAARSDVSAIAKKADRQTLGALFAGALDKGLVSPTQLRRKLADIGLARSIEHEREAIRAELTAALDAAAKANVKVTTKTATTATTATTAKGVK